MTHKIISWSKSYLRPLSPYFLYLFFVFITHAILVSIIAFFHFQLGHSFTLIEDWIFKNCWRINLITKTLSFFLFLRFMTFDSYRGPIFRKFIHSYFKLPSEKFYIFCLFLICFSLFPFGVDFSQGRSGVIFQFVSFLGISAFYLIDFLVMVFSFDQKNLSTSKIKKEVLLGTVVFYLSNKLIFPYEQNFNIFVLLQFFTLLWLFYMSESKLGSSIIYNFLVIAPLCSIFGMDPILGSLYSPFNIIEGPKIIYWISIWSVAIFYLYMTVNRKHDIIYKIFLGAKK